MLHSVVYNPSYHRVFEAVCCTLKLLGDDILPKGPTGNYSTTCCPQVLGWVPLENLGERRELSRGSPSRRKRYIRIQRRLEFAKFVQSSLLCPSGRN